MPRQGLYGWVHGNWNTVPYIREAAAFAGINLSFDDRVSTDELFIRTHAVKVLAQGPDLMRRIGNTVLYSEQMPGMSLYVGTRTAAGYQPGVYTPPQGVLIPGIRVVVSEWYDRIPEDVVAMRNPGQ